MVQLERLVQVDSQLKAIISQAVAAHGKWRYRLRMAAQSGSGIDPEEASRDDICGVGIFLYGEGQARYSGSDQFQVVKECHAAFHRVAGQSAATVQREGSKSLDSIFASQSDFSVASANLVDALLEWELSET